MLGLEDCMDIRSLHQQGLSVSEIARREGIDRKTVRKYLHEAPQVGSFRKTVLGVPQKGPVCFFFALIDAPETCASLKAQVSLRIANESIFNSLSR
jgi:transposase